MQTLDLPALQVAGIVDEIWRIARKASRGATRKLPKFVVARQLAASMIRTFRVTNRRRLIRLTRTRIIHVEIQSMQPAHSAAGEFDDVVQTVDLLSNIATPKKKKNDFPEVILPGGVPRSIIITACLVVMLILALGPLLFL
jgi:hypothetical protein